MSLYLSILPENIRNMLRIGHSQLNVNWIRIKFNTLIFEESNNTQSAVTQTAIVCAYFELAEFKQYQLTLGHNIGGCFHEVLTLIFIILENELILY